MTVLISFIVPVFNGEKFIKQLIRNFQKLELDFELLIGDDNSSDKTKEFVSAFLCDSRIKLIKSEKNLGAGAMRNLLLQHARGQYIAIHDADDLFEPTKFFKQLEILKKGNVDVVGTGMHLIDYNGKVYETIIPSPEPTYLDWILQRSVVHASIMFKSTFLGKAKYHTRLKYGEDYYFLTQLFLAGARFYNIQEPLYFYRIESSNLKQRARRLFVELIHAKAEISKLFGFPINVIFFTVSLFKLLFSYARSLFYSTKITFPLKVSIILPVYNCEKYILSAINSVLSQTHSNLELIIVNDCSTDESENIILSIIDPRIKYIKNVRNLGIAESLNVGLRLATGEFIARMDQDDLCRVDRLERQLLFFNQNSDIDIIGTSFYLINEKSRIINTSFRLNTHADLAAVILARHCIFAHPTVMFRRKIIDDENFYSNNFLYAEDYELWLRIVSKYKMRNINERLLFYRVHNMSVTKKYNHLAIQSMLEALFLHNPLKISHADKNTIIANIKRPQDIGSFDDVIKTIKIWVDCNKVYRLEWKIISRYDTQHSARVYEFLAVCMFYSFKKFRKIPWEVLNYVHQDFKLHPFVLCRVVYELSQVVAYYSINIWFYSIWRSSAPFFHDSSKAKT